MTCSICKVGTMKDGYVTITYDREPTLFVMRQVPALVCDTCGTYYLDSDVAERVLLANRAARRKKVQLEITEYAPEEITQAA